MAPMRRMKAVHVPIASPIDCYNSSAISQLWKRVRRDGETNQVIAMLAVDEGHQPWAMVGRTIQTVMAFAHRHI